MLSWVKVSTPAKSSQKDNYLVLQHFVRGVLLTSPNSPKFHSVSPGALDYTVVDAVGKHQGIQPLSDSIPLSAVPHHCRTASHHWYHP